MTDPIEALARKMFEAVRGQWEVENPGPGRPFPTWEEVKDRPSFAFETEAYFICARVALEELATERVSWIESAHQELARRS